MIQFYDYDLADLFNQDTNIEVEHEGEFYTLLELESANTLQVFSKNSGPSLIEITDKTKFYFSPETERV